MGANPAAHVSIYKDIDALTKRLRRHGMRRRRSRSAWNGLERPPPTHTHRALRAASPANTLVLTSSLQSQETAHF